MTYYHWLDDFGKVVQIRDYPPPNGQAFIKKVKPKPKKIKYPLPEWEDAPF